MRGNVFFYIIVFILFSVFAGKKKMPTYGDYTQSQNSSERSRGIPNTQPRQVQPREKAVVHRPQGVPMPTIPTVKQWSGANLSKPARPNHSFGMGREGDDFITREKRRGGRGRFLGRGGSREVDCDLDERIFGSRHQHRDIF